MTSARRYTDDDLLGIMAGIIGSHAMLPTVREYAALGGDLQKRVRVGRPMDSSPV